MKVFVYPMVYDADVFNRAKTLFMKNTAFDISDIWWRLYLSAIFIAGIICQRSLLTFVFVSDLVDNCTCRRYCWLLYVSDLCWQLYLSAIFVDDYICPRYLLIIVFVNRLIFIISLHSTVICVSTATVNKYHIAVLN